MALSVEQQQALQEISLLRAKTGPFAFPNIAKQDVLDGLDDRVRNPYQIDQDNASLCGPASFFYALAKGNPVEYVKFAWSLYETGEATLNKLKVKPSEATKNFTPVPGRYQIEPVDWLVLASLRDSENSSFRYDEPSDQFAGITLPSEIESWFKQSGFRQIINKSSLAGNMGVKNLLAAHTYQSQQYAVALLINMNILVSSSNKSLVAVLPNHWVVLNSDVHVNGQVLTPALAKKLDDERFDAEVFSSEEDVEFNDTVKLNVYSWGTKQVSVKGNDPTKVYLDEFLQNYYGFVAAKK
jgi:hypothetical protein